MGGTSLGGGGGEGGGSGDGGGGGGGEAAVRVTLCTYVLVSCVYNVW